MPDTSGGLKITGMSELLKRLDALGLELGDKGLDSAVREGAKVLQEEIALTTPMDTGYAATHVLVKKTGSAKKDSAAYAVGYDKQAFYMSYAELGNRAGQPARPVMLPALQRKGQEILDTIQAKLKQALDRATKKAGGT